MKHRGINSGNVMKVLRLRSGDRLLPLGRLRLRLGHPRAAGVVGRRRQRARGHIQMTSAELLSYLGVNSIDLLDGLNPSLNPSLNRCSIQRLPKRILNLVLNQALNFKCLLNCTPGLH